MSSLAYHQVPSYQMSRKSVTITSLRTALHKQTDKRLKLESLKINSIVHKETKDFHLEIKKIRIQNKNLGGGARITLRGYRIVYLGKPKQQQLK